MREKDCAEELLTTERERERERFENDEEEATTEFASGSLPGLRIHNGFKPIRVFISLLFGP